jgi:hypothetical protein
MAREKRPSSTEMGPAEKSIRIEPTFVPPPERET